MKDKYGQEVTDDTLIADLLPEDREKISKAIANVPFQTVANDLRLSFSKAYRYKTTTVF